MTGSPESSPTNSSAVAPAQPHLRRVLGMWDLVFYGIVLIQPVGGVGIFGIANKESSGHVTLTILIALIAMMLTAVSYGRMAGLYPVAGSAYAYVGRGLNPHLGFLAGWAMFLDYLVIPVVSVVYGAESMQTLIDAIAPKFTAKVFGFSANPAHASYVGWVVFFVVLSTILNIKGIKWTAVANHILTAVMFFVLALFVVEAVRFITLQNGVAGLFSMTPIYNPATFNLKAVGAATSLAAVTYVGFDGITTLSEDVRDPKRTVPLAIVVVCVIIGVCAFLQTYLGQLAWPDYNGFKNLDTAFFDVCQRVGGNSLLDGMTFVMVVASFGTCLTGQVGAARILFGMGRDNALPRFFATTDKRNNPVINIWLIGAVVLTVALFIDYGNSVALVNFGAFIAFMGVNAAVIRAFFFRPPEGHRRSVFYDIILPALAFVFCFWIWIMLDPLAKKVGGIWCGIGLVYTAVRTGGFRRAPKMIDLSGM